MGTKIRELQDKLFEKIRKDIDQKSLGEPSSLVEALEKAFEHESDNGRP